MLTIANIPHVAQKTVAATHVAQGNRTRYSVRRRSDKLREAVRLLIEADDEVILADEIARKFGVDLRIAGLALAFEHGRRKGNRRRRSSPSEPSTPRRSGR
jgi:hypothetical protein